MGGYELTPRTAERGRPPPPHAGTLPAVTGTKNISFWSATEGRPNPCNDGLSGRPPAQGLWNGRPGAIPSSTGHGGCWREPRESPTAAGSWSGWGESRRLPAISCEIL